MRAAPSPVRLPRRSASPGHTIPTLPIRRRLRQRLLGAYGTTASYQFAFNWH